MNRYAEGTQVNIDKTRSEIEKILLKYGATRFAYGWSDNGESIIGFEIKERRYQLKVIPPNRNDEQFTRTPTGQQRNRDVAQAAYESEIKRRWRVRLLMLKAMLEAVAEEGDVTLEEVMLPWLVLQTGETMHEWVKQTQGTIIYNGPTPPLLPAGRGY